MSFVDWKFLGTSWRSWWFFTKKIFKCVFQVFSNKLHPRNILWAFQIASAAILSLISTGGFGGSTCFRRRYFASLDKNTCFNLLCEFHYPCKSDRQIFFQAEISRFWKHIELSDHQVLFWQTYEIAWRDY